MGEEAQGRKADAILAAYKGAQALFRLLKPGAKNNELTPVLSQIAQAYECTPLEGVLSHEVKRHFIDGTKVIINKETPDQKVDEAEVQVNDVFVLDVFVTTGDGKTKEVLGASSVDRIEDDSLQTSVGQDLPAEDKARKSLYV